MNKEYEITLRVVVPNVPTLADRDMVAAAVAAAINTSKVNVIAKRTVSCERVAG